jgi:hypothetical protein
MDKNCPHTGNVGLLSEVGNGTVKKHQPFQASNTAFRRGVEMDKKKSSWKSRKQPLFSPSRAQIQECCLGGSNCFVLGEKLLPSSLGVDERIPWSAYGQLVLSVHVGRVVLDLYHFPCSFLTQFYFHLENNAGFLENVVLSQHSTFHLWQKTRDFSLLHYVQSVPGTYPATCTMSTKGCFSRVN